MARGSISLLVDSPLRTLAHAMRGLDTEVKKQIGAATKKAALPIWQETTRGQVTTRLQSRLADSARVGVTTQNVFLRAGTTGVSRIKTRRGVLAKAIEFGASPDSTVQTRSRRGTPYKRRMGRGFGLPRRRGYVAHPAAAESISRFASLWVQTARRTIHETVEKVN